MLLLLPVGPSASPWQATHRSPTTRVIVQVEPAAHSSVLSLVARLGGEVGRQLRIVGGFAAALPAGAVGRLAAAPGVRAVTPDGRVHVQASSSSSAGDEVFSAYPAALGGAASGGPGTAARE